jgi:hypothetical protein
MAAALFKNTSTGAFGVFGHENLVAVPQVHRGIEHLSGNWDWFAVSAMWSSSAPSSASC